MIVFCLSNVFLCLACTSGRPKLKAIVGNDRLARGKIRDEGRGRIAERRHHM